MTEKSKSEIGPREASEIIKRFAAGQKVTINLNKEQLDAITEQWRDMNPNEPAEITFYVKGHPEASLKVAGYSYSGDACCV